MVNKQPRRDKGQRRLIDRDKIVLRRIGEQTVIRYDQLRRELADHSESEEIRAKELLSEGATDNAIRKWRYFEFIESAKPFSAQPTFFWLTAKGLAFAELDFGFLVPATSSLEHLHWCYVVRRYVERQRPQYTWRSERYLRQEHAYAVRQGSAKLPDLPDAHFQTTGGDNIAIEVELSTKPGWRVDDIVKRRAFQYFSTWYFCAAKAQPRVETAIGKLAEQARAKVSVYPLPPQ